MSAVRPDSPASSQGRWSYEPLLLFSHRNTRNLYLRPTAWIKTCFPDVQQCSWELGRGKRLPRVTFRHNLIYLPILLNCTILLLSTGNSWSVEDILTDSDEQDRVPLQKLKRLGNLVTKIHCKLWEYVKAFVKLAGCASSVAVSAGQTVTSE